MWIYLFVRPFQSVQPSSCSIYVLTNFAPNMLVPETLYIIIGSCWWNSKKKFFLWCLAISQSNICKFQLILLNHMTIVQSSCAVLEVVQVRRVYHRWHQGLMVLLLYRPSHQYQVMKMKKRMLACLLLYRYVHQEGEREMRGGDTDQHWHQGLMALLLYRLNCQYQDMKMKKICPKPGSIWGGARLSKSGPFGPKKWTFWTSPP